MISPHFQHYQKAQRIFSGEAADPKRDLSSIGHNSSDVFEKITWWYALVKSYKDPIFLWVNTYKDKQERTLSCIYCGGYAPSVEMKNITHIFIPHFLCQFDQAYTYYTTTSGTSMYQSVGKNIEFIRTEGKKASNTVTFNLFYLLRSCQVFHATPGYRTHQLYCHNAGVYLRTVKSHHKFEYWNILWHQNDQVKAGNSTQMGQASWVIFKRDHSQLRYNESVLLQKNYLLYTLIPSQGTGTRVGYGNITVHPVYSSEKLSFWGDKPLKNDLFPILVRHWK